MNKFQYQGRTPYGEVVRGVVEGFDETAVAEKLSAQGITVTDIRAVSGGWAFLAKEVPNPFREKSDLDALTHLTWELHYLIKAGIPLIQALEGLQRNYARHFFGPVIRQMMITLHAGYNLSTALAEHPHFFNELMISMVRIGERTDRLSEMFLLYHQYLNTSRNFRRQLVDILKQPTLGIIGIIGLFFLINLAIVPALVRIFRLFHADLPLPTRMMIALSTGVSEHWHHLLIGLVVALILFRLAILTRRGRLAWHRFIFYLPVVGRLLYQFMIVRMISSLSVAIHAGIPPTLALTMVMETIDNTYVHGKMKRILYRLETGASFTESMASVDFFDPMIVQMLDVGEKTSRFGEMIQEVAIFSNRELDHRISSTTSSLQPILTMIMAVMVGFVAVTLFVPMWDIIYAI